MIHTPSLAAQLHDDPAELRNLALFIARRVAGEPEAEALAQQVTSWVEIHLGAAYAWPGNVRELEQCVRNLLIRNEYQPAATAPADPAAGLAAALRAGTLTADQLLTRYCSLVFAQTGSYQETARRLGLDRRTVKGKVDPELVEARAPHAEFFRINRLVGIWNLGRRQAPSPPLDHKEPGCFVRGLRPCGPSGEGTAQTPRFPPRTPLSGGSAPRRMCFPFEAPELAVGARNGIHLTA